MFTQFMGQVIDAVFTGTVVVIGIALLVYSILFY